MDKIVITIDIDWANDQFVEYVINILDAFNICATIFATHKSRLLLSLDEKEYELGIHPNFNNTFCYYTKIKGLLNIYPSAKGIRSHGLFSSTEILKQAASCGLKYNSNTYLPHHENLHLVEQFKNFYTFPCFWIDGEHVRNQEAFTEAALNLKVPGLKVYVFHPIHIFANTPTNEFYLEMVRPHYHDYNWIAENVYKGNGIRTLFFTLLRYIKNQKIKTNLLKDLLQGD